MTECFRRNSRHGSIKQYILNSLMPFTCEFTAPPSTTLLLTSNKKRPDLPNSNNDTATVIQQCCVKKLELLHSSLSEISSFLIVDYIHLCVEM
jgi:hypothetical protein